MATLKEVQLKIQAVKKTRQITKAMNMVATSRLRGAQGHMEGFRPYAEKFAEVLGSLAQRAGDESSPLFVPRENVQRVHLVVCTSDRGLCGGFNINLTDAAEAVIAARRGTGASFSVTAFGKKGRDWARKKGYPIESEHLGVVGGRVPFATAASAGRCLVDGFMNGSYDEVHLVYSRFVSMTKQVAETRQLLPIPPLEVEPGTVAADDHAPYQAEHICEPGAAELLGDLLPRNVYVQLYRGLLETSTSEHAARMTAMDNATKACNDMLDNLTLAYNKARQAAITADLMDIVGGAEALRG